VDSPGGSGDRQSPEFKERLRHVHRVQLGIVSAELVLGIAAGVIVGLLTDSIGWGIVTVIVTGLVLVVLGSVVFAAGGGVWPQRGDASSG
jgi:F0F1-type ATP synthase assembly protein I